MWKMVSLRRKSQKLESPSYVVKFQDPGIPPIFARLYLLSTGVFVLSPVPYTFGGDGQLYANIFYHSSRARLWTS
jgi:hypothetical protein